jgi:hypothetical protein
MRTEYVSERDKSPLRLSWDTVIEQKTVELGRYLVKESLLRISMMKNQPILKCGTKYAVFDGDGTAYIYEEQEEGASASAYS